MKHYVVLFDWGLYLSLASGTSIVGIAHSPEKAKEILSTASTDEKDYAKKNCWEVLINSDVEFSARDLSDGNNEYAHFYIKEVDAIDDDTAYDCQLGEENSECEDYVPSAENGDYSPSNPWDAPGMKISDFI